ncbi:sulfotransferase family 2 domain-containing protein [Paracoccus alkenifer]|uniref:sulfotransferase family 2 domain-containing protein n=1 Tax=Paracoccus alkenifer TaxID=65735 RepID=UPI0015A683C3
MHYHIYKNAGTSFDHVLRHNYGARHECFDGPFPFFSIDQEQLDRIIMRRPDTVAFSSHQVALPQPSSLDYRVLAAVFLRNPFLRIASIYRFKRGPERADGTALATLPPDELRAELAAQGLADPPPFDATSTGIAAQQHDFAGWIEHCLSVPAETVHVSNAQTRFLAAPFRCRPLLRRGAAGIEYDLGTATRVLAGIELLGRAEMFEPDVTRFGRILAEHGLTLTLPDDTRHNVTRQDAAPVAAQVEAVLAPLPFALRNRLIRANTQDLALYDRASALISRDHRP